MTAREKLDIVLFSGALLLFLACALLGAAFAIFKFAVKFSLMRLGVLLLCVGTMGCAKQLPVIPVQPLEEIHLGASIGNHVILCMENPDVDLATKPRWVCLQMDMVRRWFAQARQAD
jgi:hypothetical protein